MTADAAVMSRMIRDLLDYTRTRLGSPLPVRASRMDLGTLGQALFDQFRTANPDRKLCFHSAGDLVGEWDADRLRQAVSNLLSNAIQHSPKNAPVSFSLNGDASGVVIEVRNEGDPIASDRQNTIFDPLVRGAGAGHEGRNPSGMGLGLYITSEIVKSHGGSIGVVSSAEAGTTFAIHLPRRPLAHPGLASLTAE